MEKENACASDQGCHKGLGLHLILDTKSGIQMVTSQDLYLDTKVRFSRLLLKVGTKMQKGH